MKKYVNDIVVVVIFFLLIFSSLSFRKVVNHNKILVSNVSILTKLNNQKNENLILEVTNIGMTLDSIKLLSQQADTIRVKDVIENKTEGLKLIFRYDKSVCESCMVEVSESLKDMLHKESICNKVVIIGNFNSTNDIRIKSNYWGIKSVYSVIDDINHDNNAIENMHFLIVDQELNIRNIFIPNAYDVEEIKNYLEAVCQLLSVN